MPALVVDASVALAWGLPDEISPYADAALVVGEQNGLRVPEIWAREITNGLTLAYIRKHITPADEKAFLAAMSRLTITVDGSSALNDPSGRNSSCSSFWPYRLRCGVC